MSQPKSALLIPLYEAKESSLNFLKVFKKEDFDYFVLINDGSNHSFDDIYNRIANETVFSVYGYEKNKGKGYALKYGIRKIQELDKDVRFIVTADGDGQHCYEDILKLKQTAIDNPRKLVLGTRDLSGDEVPEKSKLGNMISNRYYKLVTLTSLKDTQTGLRAIPDNLYSLALATHGVRYDYELNFLIEASKIMNFVTMDIKTIYEDNNKGTHFRPVRDTLRLYRFPTSYVFTVLLSFVFAVGLFAIGKNFIFQQDVFLSTLVSDVFAASFYFVMVAFVISINRLEISLKIIKPFFTAVTAGGLSIILTYLATYIPIPIFISKMVIDFLIIFFYAGFKFIITASRKRFKE